MKTIRYLLYMILLLPNIEVLSGSYSIDSLLDYLEETGYYDLIQALKIYYGDDIAIDICKEFIGNNDCEIVVRVYMPSMPNSHSENGENDAKHAPSVNNLFCEEILEYFENAYNLNKEMRELIKVILSFYYSLIKNMSKEEIINFIKRIINNKNIMRCLLIKKKKTYLIYD